MPSQFEDSEGRDQVGWNISAYHSKLVFTLVSRATSAFIRGDLGKWYTYLVAAREMMNHELEDDEVEALDKLEKELDKYLRNWERINQILIVGHDPPRRMKARNWKFKEKLRIYQREITNLLKTLGYLPNKEDRTRLSF